MSDLLQLGASGIRVYQAALKTVSNNIANASSPDYSRQTAVAQAETPLALGRTRLALVLTLPELHGPMMPPSRTALGRAPATSTRSNP